MHGRIGWILGAAVLAGCGAQERAPSQPAPIAIVEEGSSTRSGSFTTAAVVSVPPQPVAGAPQGKVAARSPRPNARRYRAAQVRALRAHCAMRPKDDPRCDGTRVVERVAFAGMDR